MNSVERVVEYIPMASEAAAVIEGHRPPTTWPDQGVISVEGLVVRYRPELPQVISGLSFATKAKEKVRISNVLHETKASCHII
jgi:ABC-type multidrug transport system fused ATPase/permease subunit